MFKITNNNFARASRYFVHFFAVVAPLRHELLNFTSPLYGVGEHNTRIVAFFNYRYGPKQNFDKICQIK